MLFFPLIFCYAFALNITRILQDLAKKDQHFDEGYRSNILDYSIDVLKNDISEPLGARLELSEAIISFQKIYPVPSDIWENRYLADLCQFFQDNFSFDAVLNLEKSLHEGVSSEMHLGLIQLEKCILLLHKLQNLFADFSEISNTLQRIKKLYNESLVKNFLTIQELCDVFPVWPRLRHLLGLPDSIKKSSVYEYQEVSLYEKSFMDALDNQFDLAPVNFESLLIDSSESVVQVVERKDWPYDDYITTFSNFDFNGKSIFSLLLFNYFGCLGELTPDEKSICDEIDIYRVLHAKISQLKYSADDFRRNILVPHSPLKKQVATSIAALELFLNINSGKYVSDNKLAPEIRVPSTDFLIQDIFIPLLKFHHTLFSQNLLVHIVEADMYYFLSQVRFSFEDIVTIWPLRYHRLIPPSALHFIEFSEYLLVNKEMEFCVEKVINLDGFRDDLFASYNGFLPPYILSSLSRKHFTGPICYMYQSTLFRSDQDIPFDCLQNMKELTTYFPEVKEWQDNVVPNILRFQSFSTIIKFIDYLNVLLSKFDQRPFLEFLRRRISMILGKKFISEIADAIILQKYFDPVAASLFMNTPRRLQRYVLSPEKVWVDRRVDGEGIHYKGTYDMRAVYSWVVNQDNYRNLLHGNAYISNEYSSDIGGPMRNYLQQCLDYIKNGINLKNYRDLMDKLKKPVNLEQYAFVGPLLSEYNGVSFFPFRSSYKVGKFVGTILAKALERDIDVGITFPEDFFRILSLIREKDIYDEDVKRQAAQFHDKMYPNWQEGLTDIENLLNGDPQELGKYSFPDINNFTEPFQAEPLYDLEECSQDLTMLPTGRFRIICKQSLRQLRELFVEFTYKQFSLLLQYFGNSFFRLFSPKLLSFVDFERWGTLFSATSSYTIKDIEIRLRFTGDSRKLITSLVNVDGEKTGISFESGIWSIIRVLSPEMIKKFISAFTGSSSTRLENTTFNFECNGQNRIPYEYTYVTEDVFENNMEFMKDFYTKVYERQTKLIRMDISRMSMVPIPKRFIACESQTCFSKMNFNILHEISDGSSVSIVKEFGSVVLAFLQQLLHDPNDIQN